MGKLKFKILYLYVLFFFSKFSYYSIMKEKLPPTNSFFSSNFSRIFFGNPSRNVFGNPFKNLFENSFGNLF